MSEEHADVIRCKKLKCKIKGEKETCQGLVWFAYKQ